MKDTSSGSDGRDVGSGEKSSRGRGERHANEDVLIRGENMWIVAVDERREGLLRNFLTQCVGNIGFRMSFAIIGRIGGERPGRNLST